jgi:hypothetical protein
MAKYKVGDIVTLKEKEFGNNFSFCNVKWTDGKAEIKIVSVNANYYTFTTNGWTIQVHLSDLEGNQMQYLGSCVDSFDPDSGSSNIPVFSDVSDFANKEETFRERVENGEDGFMDFGDFVAIVGSYKFLKSYFEFYFYPEESGNIYVAYNPKKDIHYFFA